MRFLVVRIDFMSTTMPQFKADFGREGAWCEQIQNSLRVGEKMSHLVVMVDHRNSSGYVLFRQQHMPARPHREASKQCHLFSFDNSSLHNLPEVFVGGCLNGITLWRIEL